MALSGQDVADQAAVDSRAFEMINRALEQTTDEGDVEERSCLAVVELCIKELHHLWLRLVQLVVLTGFVHAVHPESVKRTRS